MRTRNPQVVEQSLRLRNVMGPGDVFNPAAGLAALATVVHDAGEVTRKMVQQLQTRVNALSAPLLDGRVEASGRHHQQRRTRADEVVASFNTVNDCGWHKSSERSERSERSLFPPDLPSGPHVVSVRGDRTEGDARNIRIPIRVVIER